MWNKAWISGYGTYRKAYESLEVTTVAYTRALKGKVAREGGTFRTEIGKPAI